MKRVVIRDVDAEIFSVTAGAALISTLMFGLATLRSARRAPAQHLPWSLAIGAALCTIGSLCAVPAIDQGLEHATGVENVSRLSSHLCGVGLCAGLRAAMTEWTHYEGCRRRAALLRLAVAALVAATAITVFSAANRHGLDFTTSFADDRGVVAYLLIIYLYGLWVGSNLFWDAGRIVIDNARAGHRPLALGQASVAFGGLACVVYTGSEASYLLAYQFLGHAWQLGIEKTLSTVCAGLFMLCSLLGLTLSSVSRPRPLLSTPRR